MVTDPFLKSFNLQYSLEVYLYNDGNKRLLIKSQLFNYCQNAKPGKKGNSIAEMVAQQLRKTSTLPTKACPVPAGKYFWNGFKLDGSKFPLFVPPGKYIAYWNLWTLDDRKKVNILKLLLEIKIK